MAKIDQSFPTARPSDEVGLLDPQFVEGEAETFPLHLGDIAGISGLPRRAQLVVDRLNPDHSITGAEAFLVRDP
jgi:hypothetical protein